MDARPARAAQSEQVPRVPAAAPATGQREPRASCQPTKQPSPREKPSLEETQGGHIIPFACQGLALLLRGFRAARLLASGRSELGQTDRLASSKLVISLHRVGFKNWSAFLVVL